MSGLRRLLPAAAAACLFACTGPLALVPVTPLLSATLASRGGNDQERRQLAEMEGHQDWNGIANYAAVRLREDPDDAQWLIVAGYAAYRAGDYPHAAEVLSLATRRAPEEIDGWNLLGEVQRLSGKPQQATRTLEHAITIRSDSPTTYFLLGESWRDAGDLRRAVSAYQESLRLQPDNPYAWYGLGTAYAKSGDRDAVKAVIAKLESLDRGLAARLAQMPLSEEK